MKKSYLVFFIPLLVILLGIYWYNSTGSISGKSENDMWKVRYKENRDVSEPTGWEASIKQLNDEKVVVKEIALLENDKTLTTLKSFKEGRREDGTETKLHPFYYESFYLGDAPKKENTYKASVTWEKDEKVHTVRFVIE
ncbi:hypothetical protein [Peribacillus sp. CSMR9]|uniref:hypothetical protein n=1 Tax=Peribacillus sp. CSMR9 TaxID=2981350 RepID=UPI002954260F|nr:hypothetical protein [Peribacillus sp. CSMR9]MDV7765025.1 hypothetical protein [Peribacillus sp. CSMR9]